MTIKPDSMTQINQTIDHFKLEYNGYKDTDSQILAFAGAFIKDYFTYESKGEEEYRTRLKAYVADKLNNQEYYLTNSAKAIYSQAYKKIQYSDYQYDVYVMAEVEYITKIMNEEGTSIEDDITIEKTYVKVPIYAENNTFVIEELPCFINDEANIKYNDYEIKNIELPEISTDEKERIQKSLSDFFKSYFEEDQTRINYYLSEGAEEFTGLAGRILFESIEELRVYKKSDNEILAITSIKAKDKNNVSIIQKYNLVLITKENKYYIKSMDTRNSNLNINKTEE